jgi:3-deoxy-D-manno-octulosonic-acid transferase
VWFHAASVGEAVSVLSLIEALRRYFTDVHILVTTGTVTSAALLEGRLPVSVSHQFIPVDRWPYVVRFLDHWRPDLALWVESELWPNMLTALRQRGIPAVLLNGRMSAKSFRRWSLVKGWARDLLGTFSLVLAQTNYEASRFSALGAKNVTCIGNLKYAADPLPADPLELERLRSQIRGRPVWLMASTHEGEDEIALDAHKGVSAARRDLLTIIVPRHPARGEAILKLVENKGLNGVRRSRVRNIDAATAVYVADTMGELGLFYRLAPMACVGGSFAWGGHNPIEPAQLGCAMLFGPNMANFAAMAEAFLRYNAAVQVHSPNELTIRLQQLFDTPSQTLAMAGAARAFVRGKRGVLDETLTLLEPFLANKPKRGRVSS